MEYIAEEQCKVCENQAQELHHIVYKSQCISLKDCKLNHVYLCSYHHRNQRAGAHFCKELDNILKLGLQQKLELLFLKNEFTREQIGQALEINKKATDSLCKTMEQHKGLFYRDDIIRQCMGGRLMESEVSNDKT